MTVMNAAAYGFTLLAARRLGPAGYSAVAALMGVVLVVNVLALGVQATTARRVTRAGDDAVNRQMLRTGARAGLLLGVCCLVVAPLAALVFRLDTWLSAAAVGVTAAALCVNGAQLGVLQGGRRWRDFGLVSIANGIGRLGVAGLFVVLWPTPLGAMSGVAVGSLIPVAAAHVFTRQPAPAGGRQPPSAFAGRPVATEVLHDSHTLLAFFVLTQADVFAARIVLPEADAGVYAAGLILAKAVMFLPTFVTVMAFPALARRGSHRHLHHLGLGIVLGIGMCAVVAALVAPELALVFVGGDAYSEVEPMLWLFALLGMVTAMIQLLVQTALARSHRHAVWWIWGSVAAVVGGVTLVSTVGGLLSLVVAVDVTLLGVLVWVTWSDDYEVPGPEARVPTGSPTEDEVRA